ncbi:MAG: transporter, partial [Reyranella sp.]|nr:transporter [Reyranella sp.]
MTTLASPVPIFFGRRVVAGAFVLAVFGWGLGFYGPPVYLQAVREARNWSVVLVSSAVTLHFLVGAVVVANLPALYRRFGLPSVTKAGAVLLA